MELYSKRLVYKKITFYMSIQLKILFLFELRFEVGISSDIMGPKKDFYSACVLCVYFLPVQL